jgi:peptide/nickel transport system substrate-binding protein
MRPDSGSRVWASAVTIAVLLLAGAMVFLPTVQAAVGPGPQPKVFTTLRVGALQEPDSLNPFVGVLSGSYEIWAHTYELLVGIGPDTTPVPALAQSWSVDASQRVWTFNLVHNATWHDSTPTNPQPFTAEDVNFTFRRIWTQTAWNPLGCNLGLLQSYLGNPATNTGVDVNNITVLDPYTIRIPTYQPKANILAMFIQILPKHIWASIPCNQATHVANVPPIGTGMYKLTTWVHGTYIQLDLNTNYWRLDPTQDYVDRILITYYADATGLYNAFVAGTIDATAALPADKFNLVPNSVGGASSPNVGRFAVDAIEMAEVGACLASDQLISDWGAHGGRNWLLTNVTVRQALQFAVDRQNLVDNVISGEGRPGSTLIPPATPYWHYNVTAGENYSFNLNRARALLNDPAGDGFTLKAGQTVPGDYGQNLDPAAGNNQDAFADTDGDNIRDVVNPARVVAGDQWGSSAPNSNMLSFTISVRNYDAQGQNAALRMENWWSQVGIRVTTDVVTESKLIGITYACSEDMYIWGWGGDVDPDFLLSVMTTEQILNWQDAWYSNATYDSDYVKQQQQVNPTQRQQTIWEMQKILYHDAAYLIMYYPYSLTVVRTDTFVGWGSWNAHPGLGLTGYGNDLVMLTVRAAGGVTNQCPTTPVLEGAAPRHVYANVSTSFTANASDPEDDPITWVFYWGQGNTSQSTTPAGVTQATQSFLWNITGTYNVTAIISDGKCGSTSTSAPFQVIVDPLPAQYGWIFGTVRDGTNPAHPAISGATVDALLAGGTEHHSTSTDANGGYNLTVAVGTFPVVASQALYTPDTRTGVVVAQKVSVRVDFNLTQNQGWIAGRVTSSASGSALGNVTIRVTGPRQTSARTDGSGDYNVTLPPGTYNVSASRSGYYDKNATGVAVVIGTVTTQNFALDPLPVPPEGLSPLVVAAIGLGVVAVIAVLAIWLLVRRRKKEEEIVAPPEKPSEPPKSP